MYTFIRKLALNPAQSTELRELGFIVEYVSINYTTGNPEYLVFVKREI